jgi:hypothetical protein
VLLLDLRPALLARLPLDMELPRLELEVTDDLLFDDDFDDLLSFFFFFFFLSLLFALSSCATAENIDFGFL